MIFSLKGEDVNRLKNRESDVRNQTSGVRTQKSDIRFLIHGVVDLILKSNSEKSLLLKYFFLIPPPRHAFAKLQPATPPGQLFHSDIERSELIGKWSLVNRRQNTDVRILISDV